MSKGPSEAVFSEALNGLDLALYAYKPPDDARTRKPCDFMVWFRSLNDRGEPLTQSAWFEVKDVDTVGRFNVNELRPAQKAGIRDAGRVGIRYYLAVYWRSLHSWTIGPAYRILEHAVTEGNTSIPRTLMMSRLGVETTPGQLGSTLKDVLLGEID
jgi:hypothetical protein